MLVKYIRVLGIKDFMLSIFMYPVYFLYRELVFKPNLYEEAEMCNMDVNSYCAHRLKNF